MGSLRHCRESGNPELIVSIRLLDSCFRRNDKEGDFATGPYEVICRLLYRWVIQSNFAFYLCLF